MNKVSLVVHQRYLENVIKNLHENGTMEIVGISREEAETSEEYEQASIHPDAEVCTNYELRLSRLIDILNRIKSKPKGIKAIFKPQILEKKTVEEKTLGELYSYAEGLLEDIEKRILNHEQRLNEVEEQIQNVNSKIGLVTYLQDFELDLSDIGESEYLIIKAGKTTNLPGIKMELENLETAVVYSKQFAKGKETEWGVVIAAYISEKELVEKICRQKITLFDLKDLPGVPKKVLQSLENKKKDLKKERKQIKSDLQRFVKSQLQDLLSLREEIQLERVRREVSKNFGKTNTTYIIKGWVLERDKEKLENAVSAVSMDHILTTFETPKINPDNPPVYLETPKWTKSFKTFLDLFATPRYNELNPTIFLGIFFVLFFGIMLGDAGYGLVILFLSLWGYFKFSKISSTIRDWSFMGLWLGLITTAVGFLTNSFFGDLIPRFFYGNPDRPLYNIGIAGLQLPIQPLRDPLTLLIIALIFGLIHMNLGVILGMAQELRRQNYKLLITKNFCWIPLQIGGGMLIGYFILDWKISITMLYIAGILTIIGFILLFVHAGPTGFFDLTGYVGDWLSYARLLALGLATAGMALAFNVVGELIPGLIPVVGIIFLPIILVIAHVANLGIQALGAGVHSLRLQYVEFFNRFYEGGGREFSPFKMKRRYTKLEEK
ncbi:MAG: V-type ATP synthase subunit I [Elusimicrobiota bacterium]